MAYAPLVMITCPWVCVLCQIKAVHEILSPDVADAAESAAPGKFPACRTAYRVRLPGLPAPEALTDRANTLPSREARAIRDAILSQTMSHRS